jgi:hypothetical protein
MSEYINNPSILGEIGFEMTFSFLNDLLMGVGTLELYL